MDLYTIILAAGKGKRMHSTLPKVLHDLGGKTLLEHVIETAESLNPAKIYIVNGHRGAQVQQTLGHLASHWIEQKELLGTGHAVQQALPYIPAGAQILVLFGDVPLISTHTLQTLCQNHKQGGISVLTAKVKNPAGLGRIVRNDQGYIQSIVEDRDATGEQLHIHEIFTGIMLVDATALQMWLNRVNNHNAQQEYYLTDVVSLAVADGYIVQTGSVASEIEIKGVNDRSQLAVLERHYQQLQAQKLMEQGVSLRDPARLDIRGVVVAGEDVVIDVNVILAGQVSLGNQVTIGPNCYLKDVILGDNVVIHANSVLEGTRIDAHGTVGPFARLRPGTNLGAQVKIGNFVEIKASQVGEKTKINHLSYIGDSKIGKQVNVGAGVITCNYDGQAKHQTVIEDQAFIGSNAALVAPVKVGVQSTIGAGSVITEDVPAKQLSIARARQVQIKNWQSPVSSPVEVNE